MKQARPHLSGINSNGAAESPEEARARRFLAVAWASCKVDGHLHIEQWQALRSIQRSVGADDDTMDLPDIAPPDVPLSLEFELEALSPMMRQQLFAAASWVAISDGRAHGAEMRLLCELRQALDLDALTARSLLGLASKLRRSSKQSPRIGEFELLLEAVRQGAY